MSLTMRLLVVAAVVAVLIFGLPSVDPIPLNVAKGILDAARHANDGGL